MQNDTICLVKWSLNFKYRSILHGKATDSRSSVSRFESRPGTA